MSVNIPLYLFCPGIVLLAGTERQRPREGPVLARLAALSVGAGVCAGRWEACRELTHSRSGSCGMLPEGADRGRGAEPPPAPSGVVWLSAPT